MTYISAYGPQWYIYTTTLNFKEQLTPEWAVICMTELGIERKDLSAQTLEALGVNFPFVH